MLIRLLGAFVGWKLLGFFGIFIGYIVAGAIHRYVAFGAGAVNPLSNGQRQQVFLTTLFSLMGKLAKSDGHISESEIAHAQQMMAQLGMSAEHKQQAIEQFREGAKPEFDMAAQLQQFNAVCGHTHNLKQMLLISLLGVAHADGVFDAAEQRLLSEIAQGLGYNAAAFDEIMRRTQSQHGFAGNQNRASSSVSALAEAYGALGVTKDMTDAQIKRAYRKLMGEHHPDKLTGQGMPEDMIKLATEKAKEITAAYDLIKQNRA